MCIRVYAAAQNKNTANDTKSSVRSEIISEGNKKIKKTVCVAVY